MSLPWSPSRSRHRYRYAACIPFAAALAGCGTPPPASQFPTARAAVDRIHGTQDCGVGIQATAKIDHFGKGGRVRGDLLAFGIWPDRLRMDVVSPFGVTLATLTSDGNKFSLSDLRDKRFLFGPASACNIARLTTVPMPGHVLVSLLRGEAPVLKHEEPTSAIVWDSGGYYVVTLKGANGAEERIKVAPHPADFALPYARQRLRLVDVEMKQQGIVLYHAELSDHRPAPMASPPMPESAVCNAELPRRIHVEVPGKDEDVLFRYEEVKWNPSFDTGTFTQPVPPGVDVQRVVCD